MKFLSHATPRGGTTSGGCLLQPDRHGIFFGF
jgi:hypothetical protein